jgi:hypothetical protein
MRPVGDVRGTQRLVNGARGRLALVPRSREPRVKPQPLVPVCWCPRGAKVYVRHRRTWVLATVLCQAGSRARLSNPLHRIDGWFHVESVRVLAGSGLALSDS